MALIAEYALTPDIFDATRYPSTDLGGVYLQGLKEVLLVEGLVRNLRDGDWLKVFNDASPRAWHQRGKELLKKLVVQKRIAPHPPVLTAIPASDADWCKEAVASHGRTPLAGVVTTTDIASAFAGHPVVSAIDKLQNTPWWTSRSTSVRLGRTLFDYENNLSLLLRHANSIMFIDPHLDFRKPRYGDLATIIGRITTRANKPLVEIHRVCYEGPPATRTFPAAADWEQRFRNGLAAVLGRGLRIDVYIWDDFHDRYLISDLIGIGMLNGFDTSAATNNLTTWTRLGRNDRDDVQREFDPAANRHTLRAKFTIS